MAVFAVGTYTADGCYPQSRHDSKLRSVSRQPVVRFSALIAALFFLPPLAVFTASARGGVYHKREDVSLRLHKPQRQ